MGDGSLSQDEIDALLSMGDDADAGPAESAPMMGGDSSGDLDLDSLIGGGGGGLDQSALDALAGAVAGPSGGGGGGGGFGGGGGGGGRSSQDSHDNVDLLLDVTLRFTVELGRTHMFIKDVLQLSEGSVVELDKNVGDEVDILVNDRIFGRGKLIAMDEYFAVQITHILDPMERFRLLG